MPPGSVEVEPSNETAVPTNGLAGEEVNAAVGDVPTWTCCEDVCRFPYLSTRVSVTV